MKVAVILQTPIDVGGGFQYALSMIECLHQHQGDGHEFVFFTTRCESAAVLQRRGIKADHLRITLASHVCFQLRRNRLIYHTVKRLPGLREHRFDRLLRRRGIEMLYFLDPTSLALATERLPFLLTIFDLCHRDMVEFPEVRAHREFEEREHVCRRAATKAIKVFVDAEVTKQRLHQRYGVDLDRIGVMPFSPSLVVEDGQTPDTRAEQATIDVRAKYNLSGPFIFYPAQFWPHKNHIYILEGLGQLKQRYRLAVTAVFAGSDQGNRDLLRRSAIAMGLTDQVVFTGFVDETELVSFYTQAVALVMPTWFGPTNIPPLEAFRLGCPVIYSDLPGLRDQVGDAALLVDLADPSTLATEIKRLVDDEAFACELAARGRHRLETLRADRWQIIKRVLDDHAIKARSWRPTLP